MKKMLIVFIVLFSASAHGQNILSTNLKWEADETTDVQAAISKPYNAQFKTLSNQSVEWAQKAGQLVAVYTVTSVEGTWADVNSPGSITYVLNRNGNTVRMKFERTLEGTSISMTYPASGNAEVKFRIKSVVVLP